jgi:hypothetical protein
MEIQTLKLVISQQEINDMITAFLPPNQQVRGVRVRLGLDGVTITGIYDAIINVPILGPKKVSAPFETLWKVAIVNGKIAVRLDSVNVGVPGVGDMLKGKIMESITNAASKEDALRVASDTHTITVDLDRLLAKRGFPAKTNLTAVQCNNGNLVIESMSQ